MNYAQIIKHFKTASNAARELSVTRQALNWWKNHGIKKDRQKYIELLTEGKLKADK